MSGATIQRQRGTYYELTLSTPSMNFAHNPRQRPGEPTDEQRYHAAAAKRFEADLVPFDGPLDSLLPALAAEHPGITLLPLDDTLPIVQARAEWSLRQHRERGRQPCRCQCYLREPPDAALALHSPNLTLALAHLPADDVLERFFAAVTEQLYRLRGEHQRAQATPPPAGPAPTVAAPPRGKPGRVMIAIALGLLLLGGVVGYLALR